MSLQGIMVALYTPSTADQSAIDVAALDQHIQYLIKVSVHGLVPGGSTGEFTALTLEERKQLVEVCVESAAGRVPVIAGTGALSTRGGVALNCFPVKVYGEAEFWFASLKVFGLIALLITALVIACGGAPDGEALGFRYWNQPGPVKEYLVGGASGRLCAFIGTLVFSVFAFAFAPELIVATGGEMQWLRRNLPSAGRRYIYRLVFLYILGSFFIGLIASSDNARLLGGGKGAGSSPWAIAISEAGMSVYPDIVNAIILTSAWSAGNSYLYLSSRALYGLALVGTAPKIFARCTKSGIPYYICTHLQRARPSPSWHASTSARPAPKCSIG